MKILSNKTMQN